jgi:acyl dehydratase
VRVFANLAALKAAVGTELGLSDWIEISQDRIDRFAAATNDHQWIHVDPERARRESPYGTTIAHGYLTLSLVSAFILNVMRLEGMTAGINYGCNRVRFTAVVPRGARLRGRVRLKAVEDQPPNGVRIVVDTTVELEGSDRPALIAETVHVLYQ